MKVPFIDLKRQYRLIKSEVERAVLKILDTQECIMGEKLLKFEKRIASYLGVKYALTVSSGTKALYMALLAIGLKPGDEVIVPDFTFFGTAEVVLLLFGKPVFADVNYDDFCIAPESFERLITDKTKAVIPVHLYGQPAAMDKITDIASKHEIAVIEDCAQSIGAQFKGCYTGTLGDIGCFSFYPTKNLGCCGDAGMLTTNNEELYEKLKLIRDHGQNRKYNHIIAGLNGRCDTIQAAILNVKLNYFNEWTKTRQKIAEYYLTALKDTASILLPYKKENVTHVYHQFVLKVKNREKFRSLLKEKGVATAVHYPKALHTQPVFNGTAQVFESEVALKVSQEVISIPCFPEMTQDEIDYVVTSIKECAEKL